MPSDAEKLEIARKALDYFATGCDSREQREVAKKALAEINAPDEPCTHNDMDGKCINCGRPMPSAPSLADSLNQSAKWLIAICENAGHPPTPYTRSVIERAIDALREAERCKLYPQWFQDAIERAEFLQRLEEADALIEAVIYHFADVAQVPAWVKVARAYRERYKK